MLSSAKYVIINGRAIVFTASFKHSEMVPFGAKVEGAGFVRFKTYEDEYGESRVKAQAYGESTSLGVKSNEKDSSTITRQLCDTY